MQTKWILFLCFFLSVTIVFDINKALAKDINIATVNVSNRGFTDDKGFAQGSSFEIVNKIVEAAGLTYKNNLMPFGRVLRYLESGDIDIALLVPNEAVNSVAISIAYIQDVDFILIGKKDSRIDTLEDIAGKRVGFIRLTPNVEKLIGHLNIHKVESSQYSHMVKMLMRDRIDVIFGPSSNIFGALKELNYSPSDFGSPMSVHSLEMHLVYSKKSADDKIITALMTSVEKLKKDKAFQKIVNKYDYSLQE